MKFNSTEKSVYLFNLFELEKFGFLESDEIVLNQLSEENLHKEVMFFQLLILNKLDIINKLLELLINEKIDDRMLIFLESAISAYYEKLTK